jgi:hypothetical protein
MPKDALIYSTYPSPHGMRASVCRDGGAKRDAHTVQPEPFEFN